MMTIGSKSYIGQSENLEQRAISHKSELRKGTHYNEYLQRAYNKYGIVEWKVLEYTDDLNNKEIQYISEYDTYNNGYNLTEGGDKPPNQTGVKRTPQQIENQKAALPKGDDHWTNRDGWSQESKDKVSATMTGEGNHQHSGVSNEYILWCRELGMGYHKIAGITGMSKSSVAQRVKQLESSP
tara:strand:- start:64 stop:609 length:546 start_codon:yes stop_codon:yes gene_type:complete